MGGDLSAVLEGLISLLSLLLQLYQYVIVIACLLRLVNADAGNAIVRFFYLITEPFFNYIRRRLPWLLAAGIDFSPFAAYGIAYFAQESLEKFFTWVH